jgi:hypothetical protein
MAIDSVNYSMPVMVNGFLCKDCTDVDLAKAHIDPQHPSAGPFGANAKADPTLAGKTSDGKSGAVTFGGSLSGSADAPSSAAAPFSPLGNQLDLSV